MEQVGFSGFTQQTFEFFMKIGFDNTPQHFEALRSEFNEVVLAPLKQLSLGVSPTLAKIDGRLDLRPVMGGTISRIRRDTRFSKNKAPYRTKMWLKFITKDPGMRLAFYFDLDPAGCVFGLGTSHSTPQEMTEKRRYFLAHPHPTRQMIDQYAALGFVLGGPCYKRPPQTSEDPIFILKSPCPWKRYMRPRLLIPWQRDILSWLIFTISSTNNHKGGFFRCNL